MTTFQFKFKTNRTDTDTKTANVNANTLTEALNLVRVEQGSDIVIVNYNSFPNY